MPEDKAKAAGWHGSNPLRLNPRPCYV